MFQTPVLFEQSHWLLELSNDKNCYSIDAYTPHVKQEYIVNVKMVSFFIDVSLH